MGKIVMDLNAAIKNIPIPKRMQKLPISKKGFPVPWFVAKVDGEWDFTCVRENGIYVAHMKHLCWLCGEPMGVWKAFTVGPMCVINRISAEPPEHLDCSEYAVKACPFLANPRMRRNDNSAGKQIGGKPLPGMALGRNPGASAIYITKDYKPFRVGEGVLFKMGEPFRVLWYAEGRTATRAEVQHSIDTGYHFLEDAAKQDGPKAEQELKHYVERAMKYLPKESTI